MADATVDQMDMILGLCCEIAALKGRTDQFVMNRLFETRTLADMGYVDGEITEEQAQAAISIAERWLMKINKGKTPPELDDPSLDGEWAAGMGGKHD